MVILTVVPLREHQVNCKTKLCSVVRLYLDWPCQNKIRIHTISLCGHFCLMPSRDWRTVGQEAKILTDLLASWCKHRLETNSLVLDCKQYSTHDIRLLVGESKWIVHAFLPPSTERIVDADKFCNLALSASFCIISTFLLYHPFWIPKSPSLFSGNCRSIQWEISTHFFYSKDAISVCAMWPDAACGYS